MNVERCKKCQRRIDEKNRSAEAGYCVKCDGAAEDRYWKASVARWESNYVIPRMIWYPLSLVLIQFIGSILPVAVEKGDSVDVGIMTAMVLIAAALSAASLYETVRSGIAGEIIVFRYISFLPLSFQAPKRRDKYPTEYSLALLVESAPVLLAVFVLFIAFV